MLDGEDTIKSLCARMRYMLVALSCGLTLYGFSLKGRHAIFKRRHLGKLWTGNAARGQQICEGKFLFAGLQVEQKTNPWTAAGASDAWLAQLNEFTWLRDLYMVKSDIALDTARRLARDWAICNRKLACVGLNPVGWRGDILGQRVYNWLLYWPDFFEEGELNFRNDLLYSLGQQIRHLRRVAAFTPGPGARIPALKGWITAALLLESEGWQREAATESLERILNQEILADGGHVSRNPLLHLETLRHLIDLRLVFRETRVETPAALQIAIDKMAPMLRFYRHPDLGLALFNGSHAGQREDIDMVLHYADAHGRAPAHARHSGYEKLKAGKLCVFIDVGNPAPVAADTHLHAGALAIEISVGKERMIVNCGAAGNHGKALQGHERATAAHSTLCVNDTNSSSLSAKSGRRAKVTSDYHEEAGSQWITARHDGYKKKSGPLHTRRLFIAPDGEDLRGEDILEGPAGLPFQIRFHLHPKLRVSILHNQASALLKLSRGDGWRLRVSGAEMKLMDSIYLGDAGELKRAQQILLSGVTRPGESHIKWALRRDKK